MIIDITDSTGLIITTISMPPQGERHLTALVATMWSVTQVNGTERSSNNNKLWLPREQIQQNSTLIEQKQVASAAR